jgi:hypothetical protein
MTSVSLIVSSVIYRDTRKGADIHTVRYVSWKAYVGLGRPEKIMHQEEIVSTIRPYSN